MQIDRKIQVAYPISSGPRKHQRWKRNRRRGGQGEPPPDHPYLDYPRADLSRSRADRRLNNACGVVSQCVVIKTCCNEALAVQCNVLQSRV